MCWVYTAVGLRCSGLVGLGFRTRMLLALRINVLSKGHSGISTLTLRRMIAAFNADCLPAIPSKVLQPCPTTLCSPHDCQPTPLPNPQQPALPSPHHCATPLAGLTRHSSPGTAHLDGWWAAGHSRGEWRSGAAVSPCPGADWRRCTHHWLMPIGPLTHAHWTISSCALTVRSLCIDCQFLYIDRESLCIDSQISLY